MTGKQTPRIVKCNLYFLINYFSVEDEGSCPSYVIVISNGHLYKMEMHHTDGSKYTPPEIQTAFHNIQQDALQRGPGDGVGALTTGKRDVWYKVSRE